MEITCGEIAKKLNSQYYGLDGEISEHSYIVGSIGRKTAIVKTSDLDVIFDLPDNVYKKFDAYESNGQSALIQEVKNVLKERYPKTDIRGDGQVIVIAFTAYTVELVPGFMQSDGSFKYPDTNDGGSWKKTDPIPEQDECSSCETLSSGNFINFCRMMRKWKNKCGVVIGGLLIDTLVYNHFSSNCYFSEKSYKDYFDVLESFFEYLKGLNKEQVYWLALGSNQQVYNTDGGSFVDKAKTAYDSMCECDTEEKKYNVLQNLLGSDFPNSTITKNVTSHSSYFSNTEEFIEHEVPIDIRYALQIDCKVTQNGFRDFLLSHFLRNGNGLLRHNKSLNFYIVKSATPNPDSIWWKVRNVGATAEKRNCIRGQIVKSNKENQSERTNFCGPHFVECYIIKNGVCVARDRLDVPIGSA
jgi:hypothetical protein